MRLITLGLLFLVLVAGPLGTVAVRPGTRTTAVGQVAVAGLAVGVAAALSGSPRHLLVAGGLLATAVVLVAVRPPTRASAQAARTPWAPGLLVVLAAGPACAYAWAAARTTGSGTLTDDTWGLDHWPVQAAFPLAVAGVCALTGRALDSALIYIIVAFVAGFFLPRFLLNRTIRKRQRLVRWGMADALDLMVVSVEAGLGLNAAMVKVA